MPENRSAPSPSVSRRSVATGLAWSVPAVAAVSAAPFAAASLIITPGINGWVQVSAQGAGGCASTVTVTSRPRNPGRTPDGAPYGLYLYDTDEAGIYDDAKIVYWVRGNHLDRNPIQWTSGSNHSSCWSGPTAGTPATKSDGEKYTPYTWSYSCPIDPREVSSDGRLYLGDFEVSARIDQSTPSGGCLPLSFWAYREILVDADGAGPGEPELMSFERKATLGGVRGGRTAPDATAPEATETGARARSAEATEAAVESSAAL